MLHGAVYHLVHGFAKERVELVVDVAIACHLALPATKKCVPVMLVWLLMVANASALKLTSTSIDTNIIFHAWLWHYIIKIIIHVAYMLLSIVLWRITTWKIKPLFQCVLNHQVLIWMYSYKIVYVLNLWLLSLLWCTCLHCTVASFILIRILKYLIFYFHL